MPDPVILAVDCPPLSKSRVTVYARTLHRACGVVGGLELPPLDKFLEAVDIVLLGAEPGSGTA